MKKNKQNWFKIQFKKHPYIYTFLFGWPILLYILHEFIVPISPGDHLGIIFYSFPPIIFFLWFRKNKSKIKPFFKKRKKIFKPIFYTVGGIISFAVISLIITVITLGGFSNFTERAKFEYLVWNDQRDLCSNATIYFSGYGEYSEFFWKANTQFIDYFQHKPYTVVKNVVNLKDDFLYNFNHCKATRYLLRAAHQNHKVAKDILATYPGDFASFYEFDDKYLFERYRNSLDEKKLYNAALVHAFANKLDKGDYFSDLEKRRKLHKKAAEEGYLLGMQDYLYTFTEEEEKIDKSECPFILKYSNHLFEQKSLMVSIYAVYALIGKNAWISRVIYECSDRKTDFAKAILLFKNFNNKASKPSNTSNFVSTYPAIIYFNGWGNVEKDQKLAYELFSINNENNYGSQISKAYLAFIELNSHNTTNQKEGLNLLNKILDSTVSDFGEPTTYIYCDNIKYDFKITEVKKETDQEEQAREAEYLKPLKSCLNKASNDEKIESVKSYIKSWIENWFKNPELIKTLNLFG